ncbi:MAG: NAD(P)H-quinone oxidoreductase [Deltaproteobacteria bacterium]|nr:NAD(P)H-quinone oxidoreductase [Deltaproteobacteria bacterium]
MRAVTYEHTGDESVLVVNEIDSPKLYDHQVRIKVTATSVNRADILQRRGLYPPPENASPLLGLECVGTISEVAPQVNNVAIGTRVMALLTGGGYAEEVVTDAGLILPVPDTLNDHQAAGFMETFITAYLNLFEYGQAPNNGYVLVHGGGSGVGTAAVTLCREAGVHIIVTAGGPEKVARCLTHGATVALDYKAGDFVNQVIDATNGKGVDVVLDSIGAPYLAQNLACLCPNGCLVIIGLMGGSRNEIDLALMVRNRLQLRGSTLRALPTETKSAIIKRFKQKFGEALIAGRLKPVIHSVIPLEQVSAAHRLVQASSHFGKVVLQVATTA